MPRSPLLLVLAIELALQAPSSVLAQEGNTPRLDRFGDPLPVGALARLGTVRFHRAGSAAYSPDGKIIATADRDEINLWDALTSRKIRRLPTEDRWSNDGLIFSHNGKKLAGVGWAGTQVQVWDLATFDTVVLKQADGGGAGGDWSDAAAFSSDDRTIVSISSRASVFVWDVATGKKLKETPLMYKGEPAHFRFLTLSQDGRVAATQGEKKLCLWDTQTGTLLHDIELAMTGETMKFSRDGKLLVVPSYRRWVSVFSVETGKKVHSLAAAGRVCGVEFSPDGKTLAMASNEAIGSSSPEGAQVIQLWNVSDLKDPPVKFQAPGIRSVTYSPDGKTLAWRSHDVLCFMDSATGKDLRPTASHTGTVRSLAFLPDGKRIVSAGEDGTIRIWDAATGKSLKVLPAHVGEILGMALHPGGNLLASCGRDGAFGLWDLGGGKSLAHLEDESNSVVAAAFSADGKQLASGGYRGMVFLRDPATGKIIDEIEASSLQGVAFSPTGKAIATVSNDHELQICDLATRKVKKIEAKRGGSSVAYSPDGKLIAAAFDDDLLLVEAGTNRVLKELPGHWNRRGHVVFSSDSRYLASVSDGWGDKANRSIRVFEMASGTEIHSFKRELPIYAAAFSPDGSKLAVGGADATALILDLKNLTGKNRRDELSEKELAAHWESLTAADASKAYEARADLLHAHKSTVPFLAKRLQPAPAIDARVVADWIKKLDSDVFKERDEATKELEILGELVRTPMRKALAGKPDIEARQRLQTLLGKLDQLTSTQLRHVRAIEILEITGTAEALAIIERLAKGNPDGLLTTESRLVLARKQRKSEPLPPLPVARVNPPAEVLPAGPVLLDRDGDPMPGGAIARLGSARWRVSSPPQRIMVSEDGKTLAVVNNLAGIELFDSQTGKNLERARSGYFGWIVDLRMAVTLSPDWQKAAGLEADKSSSVLSIFDRNKAEKVIIVYHRKPEDHPVTPEEIESSGSSSGWTAEYLSAVCFAPDGKTLVGAVRFEWNASSWRTKAKAELNETHLVAWDAATGKEIWKRLATGKATRAILFSQDGKTMTVVDETGVGFWDPAAGKELRRWKSDDPLFIACYSPDRKWLATGSKDKVLLWEVATGKIKLRLTVAGDEIKAIAFSPDGKLLAGGGAKMIRFWNPLTGKLSFELPLPETVGSVETVAFAPDGKTLFSGHEREHVLRRWDVAGRKPIGEFNSPTEPVRMLAFSRDSRTILSTAAGKGFYLWEAETGKPRPLPSKDDDELMIDWLASSGQAALLRCEDSVGSQFAMLLTGRLDRLEQIPGFLGSSVDGQRVLVRTEKDEKPCLVVLKLTGDRAKGKDKVKDEIEREFVWKDGKEVRAALSPDGKTVAAAGKDVVYFYDVMTGKERRHEHPTNVEPEILFRTLSVKFSADGSRIALIGDGGKIRVLAVKDGRQIAELATRRTPTGLAFSPDGQTLLTTSLGGPTVIWEIATGQAVRKFETATYFFSPDNRLLGGLDRSLKIYDLYSGRVIRECKAEGNALGDCAFSPSGKLVAASCSDTSILVWPTSAVADVKAGKPFDDKILAEVLEKGNAADAYQAIGRMITDPARTLSFLERRLRPMTKTGAKGDADEKQPVISPDDILHLRAIQALERIGTKRARQMLENLAQGAESNPRTRAAVEALRRMVKAH